jgi:hypothetical protein
MGNMAGPEDAIASSTASNIQIRWCGKTLNSSGTGFY